MTHLPSSTAAQQATALVLVDLQNDNVHPDGGVRGDGRRGPDPGSWTH